MGYHEEVQRADRKQGLATDLLKVFIQMYAHIFKKYNINGNFFHKGEFMDVSGLKATNSTP